MLAKGGRGPRAAATTFTDVDVLASLASYPPMKRRFGRYVELRSLAAGGMGEIVLVEHTGLSGFSKRVAVKRIRASLARDRAYVELFLNEARLGSFLNHPNIVHIFDVGHEDGALWLVMEYVDGVDLKRLSRRARRAGRPIAPPVLAAIALEVLSALREAHSGGPRAGSPIIHRDLSPENVMVARSGGVKVLDFGLAKWNPDTPRVSALEGNVIFGKVRYMPPEQLRGELLDPRADLFSLGATLYEVARGELPFGRGSAQEILDRILAGPPRSATEGMDPEFDQLLLRALAPDPEQRFSSAESMRQAFLTYLDDRPTPRLPLETLRRVLTVDPEASGPNDDGRPTELDLPVPARCGKCGGEFFAAFLDDMIVDRCRSCDGVWLGRDEVKRLVGPGARALGAREAPSEVGDADFRRAPLDGVLGSCPHDRSALVAHPVPGRPAHLEVCPRCLGVWFDEGEVVLLESGEVATWLRFLLDTLAFEAGYSGARGTSGRREDGQG